MRNHRFEQFAIVFANQFQLRQRAYRMYMHQPRRHALGTSLITRHLQIVRTHIAGAIGRRHPFMLCRRERNPARLLHAIADAAMEQVHIAKKTVHEG